MGEVKVGSIVEMVYAYTAQRDDELTVNEGEVLTVKEVDSQDGWIKGQCVARIASGFVPLSYVKLMEMKPSSNTG